jgi:hypothetical protein
MPVSPSRLAAAALIFSAVLGAVIVFAGNSTHPVAAQAKPAVLAQMNASSAKFTSAQADLRQELFTKALHDTETQTGQIYFLRKAGAIQMGMKMLPPDATAGTPPAQIIEFKDGKLQVLNTGTNQIDQFTATGKNQSLAETIMTLGFGGSGNDLDKAWIITDQGPETLSGVQTEKLDLVSKDATIKNNYYSHITIWVDPVRDVALKQMLFAASDGQPTGDTRTVYYTNIRVNQPVDTNQFAIKCKGKCNVVSH